ncbi:uncharacterized protein [Engystomops pustulosus]|uniref:uncharacterized protein n=1 Tax=Engystomops pustulosus TaxID=76066 RepID=UPI003AFB514B
MTQPTSSMTTKVTKPRCFTTRVTETNSTTKAPKMRSTTRTKCRRKSTPSAITGHQSRPTLTTIAASSLIKVITTSKTTAPTTKVSCRRHFTTSSTTEERNTTFNAQPTSITTTKVTKPPCFTTTRITETSTTTTRPDTECVCRKKSQAGSTTGHTSNPTPIPAINFTFKAHPICINKTKIINTMSSSSIVHPSWPVLILVFISQW